MAKGHKTLCPQNYRVKDVNEAVKLAKELQQDGSYNWFRGQRENWELRSSLSRLDGRERALALEKLGRFENWINITPGLEELSDDPDKIIAIAQHYGLPTNFIDFTTEPEIAGFFASDGIADETKEFESCILCLDTNDLLDFWRDWYGEDADYPLPEPIVIEVDNLWRLQAQHGVFLFCPYQNLERVIYDIDRIVFPYTGKISSPRDEVIYPPRKSYLEILLDQYFMNERLIIGNEMVKKNFPTVQVLTIPPRPPYSPELVANGILPPEDASWSGISAWLVQRVELFFDTTTEYRCELIVDLSEAPLVVSNRITATVLAELTARPNTRQKTMSWVVRDKDGNNLELFINHITKLYDGLRLLPYNDQDLSRGMGNCIAWLIDLSQRKRSLASTLLFSESCFGEMLEIEFGADDGSYSKAFAPSNVLLEAVREDIGDYLSLKYKAQLADNIIGLLQAIQSPKHLFNFERLARLFAWYIAPIQVVGRGNSAIYYSPARITKLGLS